MTKRSPAAAARRPATVAAAGGAALLLLGGWAMEGALAAKAPAVKKDAPAAAVLDAKQLGQRYTAWFYAGKMDELWARFSPEMRQAFRTLEGLRAFRQQVSAQVGTEQSVLSERVDKVGVYQVYTRLARFSGTSLTMTVEWSIARDGAIGGFYVRPRQP